MVVKEDEERFVTGRARGWGGRNRERKDKRRYKQSNDVRSIIQRPRKEEKKGRKGQKRRPKELTIRITEEGRQSTRARSMKKESFKKTKRHRILEQLFVNRRLQ